MITALSGRELDVLNELAKGKSNKAIAAELSLEETTVRTYTTLIYDKLGVSSRTEAVLMAQRMGLISVTKLSPVAQAIVTLIASHPEVHHELTLCGVSYNPVRELD